MSGATQNRNLFNKTSTMKHWLLLAGLLLLAACTGNNSTDRSSAAFKADDTFSVEGKQVIVFTTAENTDYRLSVTDTLVFSDFDQPLETQPSRMLQMKPGPGCAGRCRGNL